MTEKEKIARQALMCLVAEAGRSVANDVKTKVEAVLAEKDVEIDLLRARIKTQSKNIDYYLSEKDKEIARLREALKRIDLIDISEIGHTLQRIRDTVLEALGEEARDERDS